MVSFSGVASLARVSACVCTVGGDGLGNSFYVMSEGLKLCSFGVL